MDSHTFKSEVREWLEKSGKLKELQTKLRSDLIKGLSEKRKAKGNTAEVDTPVPEAKKAINSLVLEQLILSGHWYTASVFASEATFLEDLDPLDNPQTRPQKFPDGTIDAVLAGLDVSRALNSDQLRVAYYRRQDQSLLEVLLRTVSHAHQEDEKRHLLEKLGQIEEALISGQGQRRSGSERKRIAEMKDNVLKQALEESGSSAVSSEAGDGSSADSSRSDSVTMSDDEDLTTTRSRQSREIRELRTQLSEAQSKIKSLRTAREETADLKSLIEAQKKELERIKEKLDESDAQTRMPNANQTGVANFAPRSTQQIGGGVGAPELEFITEMRTKIDHLSSSGFAIEKELSRY